MTHSIANASRGRTARKQTTRAALLARATARIRSSGFSRLKTADVARDAGLSHGALFVHFPTRDSLVREAAFEIGRAITDALYAQAAAGSDLRRALRAHLAAIQLHEESYRSLLIEAAAGGPLLDAWTGIQSAVAEHLSGALERALRGRHASRASRPLLFNLWIGLVHHYVLNRGVFASGGKSALREHGPKLVDFYLSLVNRSDK